ncbi:hypothetical protein D3C71_2084830 [compost metagenome]
MSVNTDPCDKYVQSNGGAYAVGHLPATLIAEPRGRVGHYEIIPREPMTLESYKEELKKIKLTPVAKKCGN